MLCFMRWSKKGVMTSTILSESLMELGYHNLFDKARKIGVTPFGIFDGHRRRLEAPFLKYTNTGKTKWNISFGVPYGTAL